MLTHEFRIASGHLCETVFNLGAIPVPDRSKKIMLKTVLAAMLAATALVPAAAFAQDGGRWHGRGGNNAGNGAGNGGGEARPARGNGGQWNAGNRQVQPRAEVQPQVQQPVQIRPQFRDGGNRANGGWQNRGFDGNRGPYQGGRNRVDDNRNLQNAQPRQFQPQGNPNVRGDPNSFGNRGRFNGGDRGRFDNGNRGVNDNRFQGNRGGYQGGYANRGTWNREWRRDGRYDYGGYRSSNRYAYHLPSYYAPYGWDYGYRRFDIGYALSDILFAQDYWIDDPYDYRLPAAYGPYRWVRYYNDALLVDIESGEVVDAVYDIFW